jgi:hypothetical protein
VAKPLFPVPGTPDFEALEPGMKESMRKLNAAMEAGRLRDLKDTEPFTVGTPVTVTGPTNIKIGGKWVHMGMTNRWKGVYVVTRRPLKGFIHQLRVQGADGVRHHVNYKWLAVV